MTMTQVNTRIEADVKERGDAVLAQVGYSPSQVVRAVWHFASSHAHEPQVVKQFLQQAEGGKPTTHPSVTDMKLDALEQSLNLHKQLETVVGAHRETKDSPFDRQLRGEAVLARWEERGLL